MNGRGGGSPKVNQYYYLKGGQAYADHDICYRAIYPSF